MPRCTLAVLLAAGLGLAALLVVSAGLALPTSIVRALPARSPAACIPVNSDITTTTTWRADCYRVTTDTVTINPLVVLSIIPDTSTRIEFAPATSLVVRGSLQALGASDRPITFTSAVSQTACAWAGIIFDIDSPWNGNLIQYATIEYACRGLSISGARSLDIYSNTIRYNGDPSQPDGGGGITGITDWTDIKSNTFYSNTTGIKLNKSEHNTIANNTLRDHTRYGILLAQEASTQGGSTNLIQNNEIVRSGLSGLQLEDGYANKIFGNSIYLNPGGAIVLSQQAATVAAFNHVYSNGGSIAYHAAIFVTGTGSSPVITGNTLLDLPADAISIDASAGSGGIQYNALCAVTPPHFKVRNNSASVNAPDDWWGTNTPVNGTDYLGQVTLSDPIMLSITLGANRLPADPSATTIVTVTLRDSLNNTVPKPNRPGDPNARRIALQSTLGSINPAVLDVNDQGVATAVLTAAPQPGTGIITATAFCNYPLTATYEVTNTNVAIAKTSAVTQTTAGSLLTYTIAYSNPSGVNAPNVVITDVIPAGTVYVTDTSRLTQTITGNQIVWRAGNLTPGDLRSFTLTLNAPASNANCRRLDPNIASIGTPAIESSYADNITRTAGIDVICADWALVKTADRPSGALNEPIDFTITYTNRSLYRLSGAVITDVLPNNTSYVTDTSGLSRLNGGSIVTWTLPSLAPLASASFRLRLSFNGAGSNVTLTNTACISSSLFDSDPSNNCSPAAYRITSLVDVVVVKDDDVGPTDSPQRAIGNKSIAYAQIQQTRDLERVTDHREYVRPGDYVTYTIAVVNVSAYTSTNFILTETLPLYTHYVGGGWTVAGGRTYTQALGNLYPGTGRILYFIVQVDPVPAGTDNLINTICGFGSEPDRTPEDNCHIEDTPLNPPSGKVFLPLILRPAVGPPAVSFSSATYHVFEDEPTALITVTLDKPWDKPVTVKYHTEDGSATAGLDYTATQGILTFAPTQTILTFKVPIINDTLRDYWETVELILSDQSDNAKIGNPGVATLTIEDRHCLVPTQSLVSVYSPMDVEYDAPTDRLFIANRDGPLGGSLKIAAITPTAYISQSLDGLLSAQGVAQDTQHHKLYVVGWDWLNVLDSDSYMQTARITLGSGVGAHSVAYNPVSEKIYVTGFSDNSITIIDANTLQIRARLGNSSQRSLYEPSYIAVNTSTGKVYVTNHAHGRPIGWVTVVSGSDDQIVGAIYLNPAGELYGIAADNVHNRLYVASVNAAVVYAIDATTDTQLGYLQVRRWSDNLPVPLRMIAVNPNPGLGSKTRLWLTSSSTEDNGLDNIISLTGDWPNMEQPYLGVNLPPSPERGLEFDPVTKAVIVASASANRVTILWDTPQTQQCLWPFSASSSLERSQGLYTVVHNFAAR